MTVTPAPTRSMERRTAGARPRTTNGTSCWRLAARSPGSSCLQRRCVPALTCSTSRAEPASLPDSRPIAVVRPGAPQAWTSMPVCRRSHAGGRVVGANVNPLVRDRRRVAAVAGRHVRRGLLPARPAVLCGQGRRTEGNAAGARAWRQGIRERAGAYVLLRRAGTRGDASRRCHSRLLRRQVSSLNDAGHMNELFRHPPISSESSPTAARTAATIASSAATPLVGRPAHRRAPRRLESRETRL